MSKITILSVYFNGFGRDSSCFSCELHAKSSSRFRVESLCCRTKQTSVRLVRARHPSGRCVKSSYPKGQPTDEQTNRDGRRAMIGVCMLLYRFQRRRDKLALIQKYRRRNRYLRVSVWAGKKNALIMNALRRL